MTTPELYRRTEWGYEPSSQKALEAWKKDKIGEERHLERKSDRNPRHSAKYWKMCDLVAFHVDDFTSKEQVHVFIMAALQKGAWVKAGKATKPLFVPDSISFGKMNQDAFDEFYRQSKDVIDKHLMPMCGDEVQQQLLRF